eukprot:6358816-Alexandrium_andersonii.AAC.1
MRKTQTRFRRSNLELRGPWNGLKKGTRSSRGVRSAQLFAQTPILAANIRPPPPPSVTWTS